MDAGKHPSGSFLLQTDTLGGGDEDHQQGASCEQRPNVIFSLMRSASQPGVFLSMLCALICELWGRGCLFQGG